MDHIPEEINSAIAAARAESPYERLGVTPLSSTADRKRAYRALSRLLHPDVIRDPKLRPLCNDALVRVNDAFEILSDPIRELAWRARNSFTMPGRAHPSTSRPTEQPVSPPPPSDHPEIRELADLLTEVMHNFSVEQLEKATERLIHRLLYARDCRLFILDPSLRASAEGLILFVLANATDTAALCPVVSLARLFLFEQSHSVYRQTVSTLLDRIVNLLSSDTPLADVDHLFFAARSLDNASQLLSNPQFIESFSRRLQRALMLCQTDRARDVDRLILFKLQERYQCLPTELFTKITQEAYASLLSATQEPTDAAGLRRRLHLGPDDALTVLVPLLERALERADFSRCTLYTHLLRFDLSRESKITLHAGRISESLVSFFRSFTSSDRVEDLLSALTFLKQLPDSIRGDLAAKGPLRRGALAACRRSRPQGSVPPELHPTILLGVSLIDRIRLLFATPWH